MRRMQGWLRPERRHLRGEPQNCGGGGGRTATALRARGVPLPIETCMADSQGWGRTGRAGAGAVSAAPRHDGAMHGTELGSLAPAPRAVPRRRQLRGAGQRVHVQQVQPRLLPGHRGRRLHGGEGREVQVRCRGSLGCCCTCHPQPDHLQRRMALLTCCQAAHWALWTAPPCLHAHVCCLFAAPGLGHRPTLASLQCATGCTACTSASECSECGTGYSLIGSICVRKHAVFGLPHCVAQPIGCTWSAFAALLSMVQAHCAVVIAPCSVQTAAPRAPAQLCAPRAQTATTRAATNQPWHANR